MTYGLAGEVVEKLGTVVVGDVVKVDEASHHVVFGAYFLDAAYSQTNRLCLACPQVLKPQSRRWRLVSHGREVELEPLLIGDPGLDDLRAGDDVRAFGPDGRDPGLEQLSRAEQDVDVVEIAAALWGLSPRYLHEALERMGLVRNLQVLVAAARDEDDQHNCQQHDAGCDQPEG